MFNDIRTRWSESSGGSKAGFFLAFILILGVLTAGSIWLLNEDYDALFVDLEPQDASAIVAELERMKMPYALENQGRTITIPAEEVYRTRLKLMGNGIDLHGAVGFEIFNDADFGMTDFAQKVAYQRAMQGELVRTVSALDEVKTARVHLVLPESGLFKQKGEVAKASISLTTKPGRELSAAQISGIQRLVAAAVPQIAPANVTIVDQRGVALTRSAEVDSDTTAPVGRLDVKRQVESYITRKVVEVLDRAVGPGQAIVSVDAALDYSRVKVTTEDIVPLPDTSGQTVGAVARRRDSIQGDPIASAVKAAAGGIGAASRTTELEYVNGRRVSEMVSAPGSLKRLTIGVMLPNETDPVALEKIKEVVAMAVGLEVTRGDTIAVYSVELPRETNPPSQVAASLSMTPEQPLQEDVDGSRFDINALIGSLTQRSEIVLVVGAILLFGFVVIMVRSRRNGHVVLTEKDRQQLLADLADWASSRQAEQR